MKAKRKVRRKVRRVVADQFELPMGDTGFRLVGEILPEPKPEVVVLGVQTEMTLIRNTP